ncbi:2-C-methyl-D-erythritol 4-phosphate cytidylyltransferase [Ruminococcus sp. M6(2020)]|uniref:2-C-methyl-D-erythritol 4-phosphate cytidylyltransferase n=1 Tax=Ruminococcus difficilis TaxID=2763069 RepID=A0A934TYJ6_9FIRM|nr:2-C-methyl-D-erythritol 4-phosphate cytidylyltransferase [Ruminococcus difficilis]MBK6087645.1 2-C-methyl-D-erythritol 4-phosphate cytidylyltransferase [Ruminococcus difficilis]
MVYGIIMAGGKGLRMNSNIPKQYMILDDKPILVHTVEAFLCSNLFNIVYIVIGNVWKEYTNELLLKYFSKPQLDKIKLYPCEPLSRTYSLSQAINNIVN